MCLHCPYGFLRLVQTSLLTSERRKFYIFCTHQALVHHRLQFTELLYRVCREWSALSLLTFFVRLFRLSHHFTKSPYSSRTCAPIAVIFQNFGAVSCLIAFHNLIKVLPPRINCAPRVGCTLNFTPLPQSVTSVSYTSPLHKFSYSSP